MTKSLLSVFLVLCFSAATAQAIDATLIEKNFASDSSPWSLTSIGDKVYFSAITYAHGREPWVHDTVSGVTSLLKDTAEGEYDGVSRTDFIEAGNNVFFVAKGTTFNALWCTNGTTAGTFIVKQFGDFSNSEINLFGVANGKLIFTANDGVNGNEVWVSDGTPEGTVMLHDIGPGSNGSSAYSPFIIGGELYFTAFDTTFKRWKTDGTPEGTVLSEIQNIGGNIVELNGSYYFYTYAMGTGSELWKTDGTLAGTQIVKDIYPGNSGSSPIFAATRLNDKILFVAQTAGTGYQLWSTDGTSEGTTLVKTINPSGDAFFYIESVRLIPHNGKVYFTAYTQSTGLELWTTDGTEAGTIMVKDINSGTASGGPDLLTSTNDYLIFSAVSSGNENGVRSLWTSDGTSDGTVQLASPGIIGNSSMEFEIVANGGDAYFQAGYDHPDGVELWKTSGTTETTAVLMEINHSGGVGPTFGYKAKAELNGKLVYFGNYADAGYQPYISDGTEEGTHVIKQIGNYSCVDLNNNGTPMLTKAGGKLYFRGIDTGTGYEIFTTDGTAEGTMMVKDIAPGNASSISEYPMVMAFNDILLFVANNQVHGFELWRTDGTEAGTYILKDIYEGSSHGFNGQSNMFDGSNGYAILNGFLYFTATNGTQTSIYKTDGTAAGTQLAFNPYSSGTSDWRPQILNATGNKFFYSTNLDNSSYGNHAIWSSEGTAATATLLGDYNSSTSVQFEYSVIFNDKIYFSAVLSGYGRCLMKSDGTVAGTSIVKNNLGQNWRIKHMSVCGDFIYFALGEYYLSSFELWRSDGTTAGTIQIDGAAISGNEYFSDFTCIEDTLAYLSYQAGNVFNMTNGYPESNEIKEINVLNGDNFGEFYSMNGIAAVIDGQLFFSARTDSAGYELYVGEASSLLGLDAHQMTQTVSAAILVHPNPNNGKMSIQMNDSSIINTIDVYDLTGKKVAASVHNSNVVEQNLSSLSKGIYIVKADSQSGVEVAKVIIR